MRTTAASHSEREPADQAIVAHSAKPQQPTRVFTIGMGLVGQWIRLIVRQKCVENSSCAQEMCLGFRLYATDVFRDSVVRHKFVMDSDCAPKICLPAGFQLYAKNVFGIPVVRHKRVYDSSCTP